MTALSICPSVRACLRPFYSSTGRPSIGPELTIRMLIAGYCMGIRSERRLCDEVHPNLAYRWFCRLDLTDAVPDHPTFPRNRHGRFRESDVFRQMFESVVGRCIREGPVGGERFAVDASLIRADANKQDATPIGDWPAEQPDPQDAPRAVREHPDMLDDAAFGAATGVKPGFTSHVDPASQGTGARKGPAFPAHADNCPIDTDHAIIVDVEPRRAVRQAETGAAKTMIDRTLMRFDPWPEALVADTAYGSADMPGWLVHGHGIEPHNRPLANRNVAMAASGRPALPATTKLTPVPAPQAGKCGHAKRLVERRVLSSTKTAWCAIAPADPTVTAAHPGTDAAQRLPPAGSCDQSMKALVTWPAISSQQTPVSIQAAHKRRSGCWLLIPSAF